ncbi:MAG: winged helix-turn-helix transcriptional regulator [Gammaproteobacteria bacterium]|nr:winged helix-turn-helix transcriptional regulator [Gammaproteobacteria bacterium]
MADRLGKPLAVDDGDIDQAARSLKALSHPIRLKILCLLGEDALSVQQLVDSIGTSQSNISQHLAILRGKGLLTTRKQANRVMYQIGDKRMVQLVLMMRDVFCT